MEFDDLTINEQVGRVLWLLDNGFDVAAVVHSGGKSLHAWVRVNAVDAEAWRRDARDQLFPSVVHSVGSGQSVQEPSKAISAAGCGSGQRARSNGCCTSIRASGVR